MNETNDGFVDVEIPSEFIIKNYIDPIQPIVSTTYAQLMEKFEDEMFLISKAILVSRIETIDEINKSILDSITSDASFIIMIYI